MFKGGGGGLILYRHVFVMLTKCLFFSARTVKILTDVAVTDVDEKLMGCSIANLTGTVR